MFAEQSVQVPAQSKSDWTFPVVNVTVQFLVVVSVSSFKTNRTFTKTLVLS